MVRKREKKREKQTRVALQRLDYRESRESGWTVSLAPWHTAAKDSSSPSRFSVSFLLRWYQRVYSIHKRKRCVERVDCTLHTCRIARWCTLRHICKLLNTRARYTGSFLFGPGGSTISDIRHIGTGETSASRVTVIRASPLVSSCFVPIFFYIYSTSGVQLSGRALKIISDFNERRSNQRYFLELQIFRSWTFYLDSSISM